MYTDVVDLRRYPIRDPASEEYLALVRDCRDQLRDRGVAQLEGFLTPAAVGEMLALASRLADRAWASDQTHTVYFEPEDDSAGPDHPRALRQHSAKKAIAYDLIPPGAPIRRLYEADDLTRFTAGVLGKPVLYRSADPLDALEIAIFEDGDELGWHFDNSEFSVTVMYAEAEAGGHFDYRPWLRDEHDENYPAVQQVLHGRPGGAGGARETGHPGRAGLTAAAGAGACTVPGRLHESLHGVSRLVPDVDAVDEEGAGIRNRRLAELDRGAVLRRVPPGAGLLE
jgi:hypothetical protein